MDLHFTGPQVTVEERAAIDGALGAPTSRWEGGARGNGHDDHVAHGGPEARARRHLLLPALHAVSSRVGWISQGALNYICLRLNVPPADAYGVASFYALFSTEPRPPAVVHVCDDIACMAAGAETLCAGLERAVGKPGQPSADGKAAWLRSPCLGLCEQAPAALLAVAGMQPREEPMAGISVNDVVQALERPAEFRASAKGAALPQAGASGLRLLRRMVPDGAGIMPPPDLDAYLAAGGYKALDRAVTLGRSGVIKEVIDSKLLGRGGAAFPTGRKWEAVSREAALPHFLVCNADESEPGTFKDRVLMEENPHAVIEGMTIAAYAGSCDRGYLYIRGEYPRAERQLSAAIAGLRTRGLLGADVMGCGFAFDVDIRRGAGAYICGEETALFNSIEGFRGEPRNKPPFPVHKGLFGKPTIVNNVETLVNVLDIVLEGGAAFAAIGTPESTGTKLFCVSGHVVRPGLYEVPFGVTLRHLIDLAGGVRGGKRLQAVLLGGAAGTFVTPDELDTVLSFEGVRAIKATLGSGVVFVLDESADMRAIVMRIASFFRAESCGQCVPCRVGTVRQEELLHRVFDATPQRSVPGERALLAEIGQVMRDASICGLGQTASSAVESAFAKFKLFEGSHSA